MFNLDEFTLYKFIEFIIFTLYLMFIFFAIQIWFLWKDLKKDDLQLNTLVDESFFKKNCIYVFLFTLFFTGHEIIEGLSFTNSFIYYEFIEMLGFICIVLFAHSWYNALRSSVGKKVLPYELTSPTM